MRVLIVGTGQIGTALTEVLSDADTANRDRLDIADGVAISSFDWSPYSVIINAAAYTNVDGAETETGAREAQLINGEALKFLAEAANAHDATLVHFSTDYVFDGTSTAPYSEDSPTKPLSKYGQSKADGDNHAASAAKHYIIRTSGVYYPGSNNFVETMLRLGRDHSKLDVVSDQIMRPSNAGDVAAAVKHLLATQPSFGIYNCQNAGEPISWAGFARSIMSLAGLGCQINDIKATEYAAGKDIYAPRPAYSILDLAKLEATGFSPRDWQAALQAYLEQS